MRSIRIYRGDIYENLLSDSIIMWAAKGHIFLFSNYKEMEISTMA